MSQGTRESPGDWPQLASLSKTEVPFSLCPAGGLPHPVTAKMWKAGWPEGKAGGVSVPGHNPECPHRVLTGVFFPVTFTHPALKTATQTAEPQGQDGSDRAQLMSRSGSHQSAGDTKRNWPSPARLQKLPTAPGLLSKAGTCHTQVSANTPASSPPSFP